MKTSEGRGLLSQFQSILQRYRYQGGYLNRTCVGSRWFVSTKDENGQIVSRVILYRSVKDRVPIYIIRVVPIGFRGRNTVTVSALRKGCEVDMCSFQLRYGGSTVSKGLSSVCNRVGLTGVLTEALLSDLESILFEGVV